MVSLGMAGWALPGAHLDDDQVADLARGNLSDAEEQRARRHLGSCASCAAAVRAERELLGRLRGCAAPCPDEALTRSLASMHRAPVGDIGSPAAAPTSQMPGAIPGDSARWVVAAMLAGGVSLSVIGAAGHVSVARQSEPSRVMPAPSDGAQQNLADSRSLEEQPGSSHSQELFGSYTQAPAGSVEHSPQPLVAHQGRTTVNAGDVGVAAADSCEAVWRVGRW